MRMRFKTGTRPFERHEDAAPQSAYYGRSKKRRGNRHYAGHSDEQITAAAALSRQITGERDLPEEEPTS